MTVPGDPVSGLTKREWFAGQFAASGDYNPGGCVDFADELIEKLNEIPSEEGQ